ncbi:MAG TPA: hypothetical protein VMQ17_22755 [Candidatus Sulfotelmatobacter sp.]|nr:hypothetical protein [Candidatus Sulfotelmatobacter sp.]
MAARAHYAAIDVSLAVQVLGTARATRVDRQGHVELGDMDLDAESGEARDIAGDGCGVHV